MTKLSFVLPVKGGSGGAHSVMQEVAAMIEIGIDASVYVNRNNADALIGTYKRYLWADSRIIPYSSAADLGKIAQSEDYLIATTNTSTYVVAEAVRATKGQVKAAYYIQDYEPFFYQAGTVEHEIALKSYSLLRDGVCFAKTNWLCDIVKSTHGLDVQKVTPSIDHAIYRPSVRTTPKKMVVCAMIRPGTPRRAPRRTIRVLDVISSGIYGEADVFAFGVDRHELELFGIEVPPNVHMLGKLSQEQVSRLLQSSDLFLDLSDFQAFGRTAAEAMACGCLVIAPSLGGAHDFIEDNRSSLLVDTTQADEIDFAIRKIFALSSVERQEMIHRALESVSGFTPIRAALSELRALGIMRS